MFKEKIYHFHGVPISSRAIITFSIIESILMLIQYITWASIGFFGFLEIVPSELENFDEVKIQSLKIFLAIIPLSAGPIIWFIAHIEGSRLSKWFFHLQRFHFFHLIPSKKLVPLEDVFILKNQSKWYETTAIIFVGTWSFAFVLNHFFGSIIFSNIELTSWGNIIDTSVFSVISCLIIFPLTIIYSSNIRMKLKKKNLITSGFSIYKYVILSFFSVNIIMTTLTGLTTTEQINLEDAVFFIPSITLTILFTLFSKTILTSEFRNQLKKLGIVEGEIK